MTPVVIGNAAGGVRKVFEDKAAQMRAPILFACDKKLFTPWKSKDKIIYAGTPWGEIEGELTGDCQVENAATVMTALGVLCERFSAIDEAAVARGFAEVCELTGLMGRWMTVKDAPVRTVCDTGHNIGGWHWLGPKLREISESEGTLRMVVGFVNDKGRSRHYGRNAPQCGILLRYAFGKPWPHSRINSRRPPGQPDSMAEPSIRSARHMLPPWTIPARTILFS